MLRSLSLGLPLVLALGCNEKSEEVENVPQRDEDAYAAAWARLGRVVGVPNLDDDNGDGTRDWEISAGEDENDLVDFGIPGDLIGNLHDGAHLELALGGDTTTVRVWRDGELVLPSEDATSIEIEAAKDDADVVYQVEFGDYLANSNLSLLEVGDDGAEIRSAIIDLIASPAITGHHLQESPFAFALSVSQAGWYNNSAFIAKFEEVFGDRFTALKGATYNYDVWVQDEVEFANLTAPGGASRLVIDSIRDRGLDDFPENLFTEADYVIDVWGRGYATSQDSFGNFESSPPVTVDGVEYPHGILYWGASGMLKPHKRMTAFFNQQRIQKPIEVDIGWLCVGHVDEFAAFVPDPSSDKGFKLVYSDVDIAYQLLESQDRDFALPKYESGHHYANVGEILDDAVLRALNEDLRDDYLLPILEQYKTAFGLSDEDVIRIPSLFEEAPGCGRYTAALIPGTANLVVDNHEGVTTILTADPFFRQDPDDQSSDPVIADFVERMPDGSEIVFVDDWSVYHMGLGEVHCGSNTIREPSGEWWNDATHLTEVGQ